MNAMEGQVGLIEKNRLLLTFSGDLDTVFTSFFTHKSKISVVAKPPVSAQPSLFGLGKAKFGLGKKKPSIEEKDEPNPAELHFQGNKGQLLEKARMVFRHSLERWGNHGHSGLALCFFEAGTQEKTLPVLFIPCSIRQEKSACVLEWTGADPFINPGLRALFEQKNLELPQLPELFEEYNFTLFSKKLEDAFIPLAEVQFKKGLSIVAFSAQYYLPHLSKQPIKSWRDDSPQALQQIITQLPEATGDFRKAVTEAILGEGLARIEAPEDAESATTLVTTALALNRQRSVLIVPDNQSGNRIWAGLDPELRKISLPIFRAENRRSLYDWCSREVDLTTPAPTPTESQPLDATLDATSTTIDQWISKINRPLPKINRSIAELIDEQISMADLPEIPLSVGDVFTIEDDHIQNWIDKLKRRDEFTKELDRYSDFSFSDAKAKVLDEKTIDAFEQSLNEALEIMTTIEKWFTEEKKQVGLRPPISVKQIDDFLRKVKRLNAAPKLVPNMLKHSWSKPNAEVNEFLQIRERVERRTKTVSEYFWMEILDEDLQRLVPQLQKQKNSTFRVFNFGFKKELNRLRDYILGYNVLEKDPSFWPTLISAQRLKEDHLVMKGIGEKAERYFGEEWDDPNIATKTLAQKVEWITRFEKRGYKKDIINQAAFGAFLNSERRKALIRESDLKESLALLEQVYTWICETLDIESDNRLSLRRVTFEELKDHLTTWLSELPKLKEYFHLRDKLNFLDQPMIRDFMAIAAERNINSDSKLIAVFRKSVYGAVLKAHIASDEELASFNPQDLEQHWQRYTAHFKEQKNQTAKQLRVLTEELRKRRKERFEHDPAYLILQHELRKTSRLSTAQKFLFKARNALFDRFPLWIIRRSQIEIIASFLHEMNAIVTLHLSQETRNDLNKNLKQACIHLICQDEKPNEKPKLMLGLGKKNRLGSGEDEPKPIKKKVSVGFEPVPEVEFRKVGSKAYAWREICNYLSDADLTKPVSFPIGEQDRSAFSDVFFSHSNHHILLQKWKDGKINFDWHQECKELIVVHNHENKPKKTGGLGFGLGKKTIQTDQQSSGKASVDLSAWKEKGLEKVTVFNQAEEGHVEGLHSAQSKLPKAFTALTDVTEADMKEWSVYKLNNDYDFKLIHKPKKCAFIVLSDYNTPNKMDFSDRARLTGESPFEVLFYSTLHLWRNPNQTLNLLFEKAEASVGAVIADQEKVQVDLFGNGESIMPTPNLHKTEISSQTPQHDEPNVQDDRENLLLPDYLKEPVVKVDFEFAEVSGQQGAAILETGKLPIFEPYILHDGVLMGDRMDFFNMSSRRIDKLIVEIVHVESPIHWKNLVRTVATYWQISRIDSVVTSAILSRVQELVLDEKICAGTGCLFNNRELFVKARSRGGVLPYAEADEIPLLELKEAVLQVLKHLYPLSRNDLRNGVVHCLDWMGSTTVLDSRIDLALYLLGEEKKVSHGENGFQLNDNV